MFSDNHKISVGQLHTLLITDWVGKTVLLIPKLVQGIDSREALLTACFGLFFTVAVMGGLETFSGKISGNYYGYVQKQAGDVAAFVLYLVYGLYFLLHSIVMLYLSSALAAEYLLPDMNVSIVMLLPLTVGYFLARGGLEVRGRVSELIAGVIVILLVLMLGNGLFQMDTGRLWHGEPLEWQDVAGNGYLTVASFGSILALPFVLPEVEKKKGWKLRLYVPLVINGLLLAGIYLTGFGIFGTEGMQRLDWPMIALMSSMNLQGVFLQRWDILFVGLLQLSLFFAVGTGIYYMENILFNLKNLGIKRVIPTEGYSSWKKRKREKERRILRLLICGAVYLVGIRMEQWETSVYWYEKIGLFGCIPLLAALTLLIWGKSVWREKKGRKMADEQK